MRILICTQKVDKNDDVLGFFHRWLEVFSKEFEVLNVVCLERGAVSLPSRVAVHSLGKEHGGSRLKYVVRFFWVIASRIRSYDAVLVHMNPEYVILGGILWKIFFKRVVLWYNHAYGGWRARLAMALADTVLYTSPYSFAARYGHARQMPAGIDTDYFSPPQDPHVRAKNTLLAIGRIAPVKRIETMVETALLLADAGNVYPLTIIGDSAPRDRAYEARIRERAKPLVARNLIIFEKARAHGAIRAAYQTHDILINLTSTGSFDKVILEAMASGMLVVTSNIAFQHIIPDACLCRENDPRDCAVRIKTFLELPPDRARALRQVLREFVISHHDLHALARELRAVLER